MDQTVKILFEQGLPGFEGLRNFLISRAYEESPFYYLQSAEEAEVCFLIINPFEFTKNYEFVLPDDVQEMLKIKDISDITVFNIINTQGDLEKATVNMQAPVIINITKSKGMQVVLNDTNLNLQEPIKNLLQGKVSK